MTTNTTPSRRRFLAGTTLAATLGPVATPALAQTQPELRWRLTSSFPKSLDILHGGGDLFAKLVTEATDGRFQIQVFAAGEIVPPLAALDAVQNGTVEMAHTPSLYYTGKDPTFAIGTAVPFGLNARQQNAWLAYAGGNELLDGLYAAYNVQAFPCGNTGNQMGGWFRRELKSLDDLKGLKFRVAGLAGRVLAKLGVVPQQIAPGDIYPALERGTIDAAEFIGPHDDEKLGLHKVAKFYYGPGWAEGGALNHVFINRQKWSELPKTYQGVIRTAALAANAQMLAQYDARNADALYRLVGAGAELRTFPSDLLDAFQRATTELYGEIGATNPRFRDILASMQAFRDRAYAYHRFADYSFDTLMLRSKRSAG